MAAPPQFDLVEPGTAPAVAPPQFDLIEPGTGGASARFDVIEPQNLDQLKAKMDQLEYEPTDDEIGRYLDLKKAKAVGEVARFASDPGYRLEKQAEWIEKGVSAGWDTLGKLTKGTWEGMKSEPGNRILGDVEGGFRGARNTSLLLAELGKYMPPTDEGGSLVVESPEASRLADIAQFRLDRSEERKSANLASGKETLLPGVVAPAINPAQAEAVSLVADPTNLIPLELGLLNKAGGLARAAGGRSLQGAGLASELVGKTLGQAVKYPVRKGAELLERVTEDAQTQNLLKVGAGAAAAAAGLSAPAVSVPLIKAGVAAMAAEKLGQMARAAGRNIAEPSFSEQAGLLRNISRDAAAPAWVRQVAGFAQPLDPLLDAAGRGVAGGIEGAAVGGALGGLAGGEEGFTSGLGAGGAFGTLGGVIRGRDWAGSAHRDLVRWRATLDPERLTALDHAMPDPTHQVRVMNAERFLSGMGDVDFNYLTDAQWKAMGLPPGRAMEATTGERPTVNVNITQIGNGAPVFHESGHVLRRLLPEQFRDLDRSLFSDFTPTDGVGTDIATGAKETSKGLLSPAEQQRLYDQYFSKLDPATQAERRATWSRRQHLQSLREEVVSELLSSLLQDKKPDFLHRELGGIRSRLLDTLIKSQERSILGRLPFVRGLQEGRSGRGSSIFSIDGAPLRVDGRTGAELRRILRVRDRVTGHLKAEEASELAGATGVVTPREMLGKEARTIAEIYGNSDTYAKDAAGNVQFSPDGKPVLLDEGSVRKLQEQRRAALDKALASAKPGPTDTIVVGARELRPLEVKENGLSWEGDYLTDAQLAAIRRDVPPNILTPAQLAHMEDLNAAIKSGRGIRKAVDYNPATKEKGRTGRRAYASQGSKFYETVPYGFYINKEGGLSVRLFDVGNVSRKLDRWMSAPGTRRQFALWNGDKRAVMADVYKYLENQLHGRPNSLHLDSDPAFAVQKRNLISDLLGGTSVRQGAIPSPLSTKAGRDNSVKMFRIDRLNKVAESAGDPFPVDYHKVKENLMPDPAATRQELLSRPGIEIDSTRFGDLKDRALFKAAREVFVKNLQGSTVRTTDGRLVRLAGSGLKEMGRHIADRRTMFIVPHLDELLSSALPLWSELNDNKNMPYTKAFHHYGNKAVIDGEPVIVKQLVREDRDGTFHYDASVMSEDLLKGGETSTAPEDRVPSAAREQRALRQSKLMQWWRGIKYQPQESPGANSPESPPAPPSANLMPLPGGVTPTAVIRHVEAQARADLGAKLMAAGAPRALASKLAEGAWKEAEKLARKRHSPHERGYALAAGALVNSLGAQELSAVGDATLKGGTNGAKEELGRQLQIRSLAGRGALR